MAVASVPNQIPSRVPLMPSLVLPPSNFRRQALSASTFFFLRRRFFQCLNSITDGVKRLFPCSSRQVNLLSQTSPQSDDCRQGAQTESAGQKTAKLVPTEPEKTQPPHSRSYDPFQTEITFDCCKSRSPLQVPHPRLATVYPSGSRDEARHVRVEGIWHMSTKWRSP